MGFLVYELNCPIKKQGLVICIIIEKMYVKMKRQIY
jgi:hypothetical protein